MRLRRRYLFLAVALGAFVLPAVANSVVPSIEAVNEGGLYGTVHRWSPSQATVAPGGEVALSNPTAVAHGVHWITGPGTPECSNGVPVGTTEAASGTNWSGTCKFAQAGTYTFYCTVHGAAMSGTITVAIPGEPTASTEAAGGVGQTEATLHGTVNPEGKATEYFFNWGTTAGYGHTTEELPLGVVDHVGHTVSAKLTNLAPGTTYHFQLVAKNEAGTTRGQDRTFTTETPPGAPLAATGAATVSSATEATLAGTVNPDGQATEYFFEWGTTAGYGQTTANQLLSGEDHAGHAVSAKLTGLAPATEYHFRVLAKNASDALPVPGADQVFTTLPPEPPSEPTPTTTTPTSPPPTATQSSAPPPPTTPNTESPSGSPLGGGPSLRSSQHGSSVSGSLDVSAAGAGGRLEVNLLARRASLASAKHAAAVRVGRLLRNSVSAGSVSFTVKLDAQALRALRRLRHLALSVRITLTPQHGPAVTVTRTVELRR